MAESSPPGLASRIRDARRAAGYRNTEQLAVLLGVGQRTVQRWETGRSVPSIARLIEIAKATRQPLGFFLNGAAEEDAA